MSGMRPPHAPEVGLSARILGRFHVTGLFWYRIHLLGARIVPSPFRGILIRLFTTAFYPFLRRIARAIAANLEAALGPCGWLRTQRRVYRTMLTFAWCLTERYERLAIGVPFETTVENEESWREVTATGRGIVLVTAHVGNWEIGSALPSTRERRQVHLVREEELDPEAQALIRGVLRERMGEFYTTHFATADPSLAIRLAEALGRGEIVALQADRPRSGGKTVSVELFGRPFELPVGPMALARSAEVQMLPVFVLRSGRRRYRICFRDPIRVGASRDRRGDVQRAAASLAQSIEWAVKEEPHQWFCFHALWDHEGRHVGNGAASKTPRTASDHRREA